MHGSPHLVWFSSGQESVSGAWSGQAVSLVFPLEHRTTISGDGSCQNLS